jgi:sigma-E factor negative regulatory protein RseC
MIEETARVESVHDGSVEVTTERKSGCGKCTEQSSCSTSVMAKFFSSKQVAMRLPTTLDLKPGDHVVLGVSESVFLIGTLLIYGAPILAMILGGVLGKLVSNLWLLEGEWLSIGFGLVSMLLTFYGLMATPFGQRATRIHPVVIRKV